MRRFLGLLLLLASAAGATAQQAPIPMSGEIGGRPYVIRDKWVIGGQGSWDYLALDPVARQLFIAHQSTVDVVDIETGRLTGQVNAFEDARFIVLDPDGQFGYVSDSHADAVVIFDRRSLRAVASIPILCAPRSMALAGEQGLLFAFCGATEPAPARLSNLRRPRAGSSVNRQPNQPPTRAVEPATGQSHIVVIDVRSHTLLVRIAVYGNFRIAQADREGHVYVTVGPAVFNPDPQSIAAVQVPARIARIDTDLLQEEANDEIAAQPKEAQPVPRRAGEARLNWDIGEYSTIGSISFLRLDDDCPNPQGIATDSPDMRLFVACDNQNLQVLDSAHGRVLSTLTVGPGTDAVAYDENRGLIFAANGGGYGSLTIVRQHQTDSYAVIQNLPTMERARTLALDPSTGLVYLVTDLHGAKLTDTPANGIGRLRMDPVDGSFQVLVIAN